MSSTWMGELTKYEVVALLKNKGYNVNDVNELILVMEKMGLVIHSNGQLSITKEGAKYANCKSQIFDEAMWRLSVLDAIYEFLGEQTISSRI